MEKAISWLQGDFDENTKSVVKELLENDPGTLEDSFYRNLEFGTGGMRGIMGAGTNRINQYTIGAATQGLSSYLKSYCKLSEIELSVAIAYDSRHCSRMYADTAARVFAANEIKVYLFDDIRPVPELSYTIRHFGCAAGVMITASHNPPEYNGYKVYWRDGAQITAPHDSMIIANMPDVDNISGIKITDDRSLITMIGKEIDDLYLDSILSLTLSTDIIKEIEPLKIVYTPLHGAGVKLIPEALKRAGFGNTVHVHLQDIPNGDFPTVESPNPEEQSAMAMAIDIAEKYGADIAMATDPDADRAGIAVRDGKGRMVLLNGNQTASLLTYYLLERYRELGRLKEGPNEQYYMVKTIVTTELMSDIASKYGVEMLNVLTGFKYISEIVGRLEGKRIFIGGGEESYGFNAGEFVRDKDAVITCVMIADAAVWARNRSMTLYEMLVGIYKEFGFYKESLTSVTLKGKNGLDWIMGTMKKLRDNPVRCLAGSRVVKIHDYLTSLTKDVSGNRYLKIELPESDVIQYVSCDHSVVSVRPSGTEPKIKFYFSVRATLNAESEYEKMDKELSAKIERLKKEISTL